MSIRIHDVSRRFGSFVALDHVDLEVRAGEFVALLGPSGSGKTTLLRVIAGLESADTGTVSIAGREATTLHARDRNIGFVFQHFALFRHMTVLENVAFGMRIKPRSSRRSDAEIRERAHELLDRVQLHGLSGRYPSELSGGQRQRVALARALATEPTTLLLDEPFGALDARVRIELRRWLRTLHDELGVTSVIVTHDQEEALDIADRVVVMNRGRVEQVASPSELHDHPATPFVLDFLGDVTFLEGSVRDGTLHVGGLRVDAPTLPDAPTARVGVRSFDLKVWLDPESSARLLRIRPLGDRVRLDVLLANGAPLAALFPRRSSLLRGLEAGCGVHVEVTRAFVALPGETTMRVVAPGQEAAMVQTSPVEDARSA